ncbi:MAG: hypothetical protein R3D69_05235 [Xanthobacteraceae bacterium]
MSNSSFLDNLNQSARDNPLAAALIAGGALWLLTGNRPWAGAAQGLASAAAPVADTLARGADGIRHSAASTGDAMSSASRSASDLATHGVDAVSAMASRAAEQMRDTWDAIPSPELPMRQHYDAAKTNVAQLLEDQPLVLGAIGLAIGAGIASAFATTDVENEVLGSTSDDLVETVKNKAVALAEVAKTAASEAVSELKPVAKDLSDKVIKAGDLSSAKTSTSPRS